MYFNFIFIICSQCILVLSKSIHISTMPWKGSVVTTSNEGSASEKQPCFGGLQCINGQCRRKNGEFLISECICDSGWTGLICDQRTDAIETDIKKQNDDASGTTKGIFGNYANDETGNNGANNNQNEITTTNSVNPFERIIKDDDANELCGNKYKPHPLKDRLCTPGLLCRFGTCSNDHQGTYIAFSCKCDKGAVGVLCEHKCCLDCGDHGSCHLFPNDTQFCNCKHGFQGERCGERLVDNTINTDNTTDPNRLSYKWIIIMSVLILVVLALLLSLAVCLIWKKCGWEAKKFISKLKPYTSNTGFCGRLSSGSLSGGTHRHRCTTDSSYQYDVLLCYHSNEEDDSFVKQILLPVINQPALKVHMYTALGSDNQDNNEAIEKIVSNSRQKIILYTPNFIRTCSNSEWRLLKNRSVFLCTKDTLHRFDLKTRLYDSLSGNIRIKCPDIHDKQEVDLFQDHIKSLLVKNDENCDKTAQCI